MTFLMIGVLCQPMQVMTWKVLRLRSMEVPPLEPLPAILQFPAALVGSLSYPSQLFAAAHVGNFARNLFTKCDVTGVTLPWETGFFRELFSDEPFAEQLVPRCP